MGRSIPELGASHSGCRIAQSGDVALKSIGKLRAKVEVEMPSSAGDSNGTRLPMGGIAFPVGSGRRVGPDRVDSCCVLLDFIHRAPLMLARPCPCSGNTVQ
jgi:hypothetical protein